MTSTSSADHALRTMCDEGNFRILVADTTDTAAGIVQAQSPDDATRKLLADLVTASILLRLTMSPDHRLQAFLQNQTTGNLISDSHPDGTTRGLIQQRGQAPVEIGPSTYLSIHRSLFGGDVHQGVVETSSEQSLADAVSGYLHRSEQITSVVDIGHRFDGDELTFAGGYLVQLLPDDDDIDQATLALMTARLQNLPGVPKLFDRCDGQTQQVADTLYGPIDFKSLDTDTYQSGCVCSRERVLEALATLSEAELDELAEGDEMLRVDCDYCGAVREIESTAIAGS